MQKYVLHNPHLEGETFFWEAGSVGVFLSHGYTATTAEVRLFAKRLHEKGYSVGGPLLAGHGSRPEDLNRVTWQDWVESGEKVYEQLKSRCEHVFLCGESMGGLVALYLAGRHPEVSGVMLYAPAIELNISTVDRIKLYLGSSFMPYAKRESLEMSEYWQGYHPELPTRGILQVLKFQHAVRNVLPHIAQPIVVFQGRKDVTVNPQAGDIILRGVASTVKEHHWMEESGHPILIDAELDEVTNLSLNFMERTLAL
ncbi:MAG TPA: alpha/beta hydrolase [Anaerolineales bacterium]|nr:alpha/beta hydrolase [Anaerolineales bacterium]HRK87542.1 alpha/beta hydrolase [Anaerolineales bacterium]